MRIGERLRLALAARNLELKEAAHLCGVPYRTLQDYVRLQREPKAETIGLICTRLRISAEWTLTGEGHMFRDGVEASVGVDEHLIACWEKMSEEQRIALVRLLQTFCLNRGD